MGAKHSKVPKEGGGSPQHSWRRTPTKERGGGGDILALLRSGERLNRGPPPPPYQRRIGMIQEMMGMAKQGRHDQATEVLKSLRQDLGMESTSLDDVLYRYASFRNLVDPITHDLIISLARYVHCPRTEGDSLGAMEKVCRQLTYHLSPHSQWRRQGLLKRKPQSCLKLVLSAPPPSGALDLSGLPLAARDMERLCGHLRRHAASMVSLEMGFTELTDEAFLLLLPTLAGLPHLETLALNGNRLTRAVLKELTDALKDPGSFPSLTWIDLGNNVDIFSLPQPFLVSLRKRCPKQGNLPTILEFGESQASEPPERPKRRAGGEQGGQPRAGQEEEEEEGATDDEANRTESMDELRSEVEEEMDGELEIEEMMEELLDFDREVRGPEDEMEEEESMWTLEDPGRGGRAGERRRRRRCIRAGEEEEEEEEDGHKEGGGEEKEGGGGQRRKKALKADKEDDTQSHSSRLSFSSQSQLSSSGAVEPMRVEADDLGDAAKQVQHLT
ncbi:leucine-rich repeat-containing protein 75A isoform X2 [Gadus macrocephalus]|uniref:leucine-rich repeat-containing protein 75A isoform X2 n=1 Tax=Gadus macrocephalus TaxID=80720 RepID=UPI0028CB6C92|nr:leucine-rich repeat-containing protein 75A isoform X2 [Gadus macrocephalus]